MSNPFPIPVALLMANQRPLATPDPNVEGTLVLRNDGTNEPRWGASPAATTFNILTTDPASPDNNTYWLRRTTNVDNVAVDLRVRIDGTSYTLASLTIPS